jgi:hypothetical protein
MVMDPDALQGQPHLPHDVPEVEAVIAEYGVRLVYIDPWVRPVSGGLRLRDTQEARRAIDPLVSLARRMHCSILAVAHPNRGEGDLRARVGLSAVLRQAARLLLYAIEPPEIYERSGSDESAANKAIGRWVKAGKLLRREAGVYELATDE